jgi:ATP-dependent Clp protease protease subunit
MIHQPSGYAEGAATDIQIHAEEILRLKKSLNKIYEKHTGQEAKVIEEAIERDKFMSAEEAASFGIIDHVVLRTPIHEQ